MVIIKRKIMYINLIVRAFIKSFENKETKVTCVHHLFNLMSIKNNTLQKKRLIIQKYSLKY